MRAISLAAALFGFWLLLSGHYTGFLLTIGLISAALCAWVAVRMRVADAEGHPIHLQVGALTYWPWLVWEIAKSSWAVIGIVLRGRSAISPNLVKVTASQKTQVGIATYGNSITLTPGTITVDVEGDELTVHALTQGTADDLVEGTMDRRVVRMEGGL
ncbi:MAG: Na+/H+ antiporter subunit E [Methyloligellaceae bacterium]